MKALRAVLGLVVGLLARLWLRTLRVELAIDPSLAAFEDRAWVLAFLHGKQWPLLAWRRRRPTVVMVSTSKDGDIQARALSVQGLTVVRGSSSRGGARGLAAIVRRLRAGQYDAAFAVDGPRGPYGVPKPGVLLAARRANAVVVPMGSAITRGKVFSRAWDGFALAWPFTRVGVVLGPAMDVAVARDVSVDAPGQLEGAIARANEAALRMLSAAGSDVVASLEHSPNGTRRH